MGSMKQAVRKAKRRAAVGVVRAAATGINHSTLLIAELLGNSVLSRRQWRNTFTEKEWHYLKKRQEALRDIQTELHGFARHLMNHPDQ